MTLKEKLELIRGVKLVKKVGKGEFEVFFLFEQAADKLYNSTLEYYLFLCFDFLKLEYVVDERTDAGIDLRVWKK